MKKSSYRGLAILLSAVIALVLAPSALAQYGGQAGGVGGQVAEGGADGSGAGASGAAGAAAEGRDSSGVLAFTGLDLVLIAGGGLLLLVCGVALSRVVARHPA